MVDLLLGQQPKGLNGKHSHEGRRSADIIKCVRQLAITSLDQRVNVKVAIVGSSVRNGRRAADFVDDTLAEPLEARSHEAGETPSNRIP